MIIKLAYFFSADSKVNAIYRNFPIHVTSNNIRDISFESFRMPNFEVENSKI